MTLEIKKVKHEKGKYKRQKGKYKIRNKNTNINI